MSDIRFRCSSCEKKLTVVGSAAGKKVKCPWCGSRIQIPGCSTLSLQECGDEIPPHRKAASPLPGEQLVQHLSRMVNENQELKRENTELKALASDSKRLTEDLRELQAKVESVDALARKNEALQSKLDSANARLDRYRLDLFSSSEKIQELEDELHQLRTRRSVHPSEPMVQPAARLTVHREPEVPMAQEPRKAVKRAVAAIPFVQPDRAQPIPLVVAEA